MGTRAGQISKSGWSAIPTRYRLSVWAALVLTLILWVVGLQHGINHPFRMGALASVGAVCLYILGLDALWGRRYRTKLAELGQPAPSVWQMMKAHADEEHRLWYLRKQWPHICEANNLSTPKTKVYPDLRDMTVTANGDIRANMFPEKLALDPKKFLGNAATVARSVKAKELRVKRFNNDGIELTFMFSDPLARIVTANDLDIVPLPRNSDDPIQATYGTRYDSAPASVPVHLPLLIGGGSGGGKSSIMWAVLGCLIHLKVPVDLYVSDPKGGMEMRELGEHVGEQFGTFRVRAYADTDKAAMEMIKTANSAMACRQRALKAVGARKHVPTRENPLVIVIIDELLADPAMLKNATTGDLGNLLSQGRAAGYIVMAGTQLAHAETLGAVRNLFPNRICVRTETPDITDTILGKSSEARGALCSEIPEKMRGVGYSRDERGDLAKFRAVWVTNADRERIALGQAPAGMDVIQSSPLKEWAVYLRYYPDGQLAYVGKTERDVITRDQEHAINPQHADWWAMLDRSQDETLWFKTEAEMLAQEKFLIETRRPIHNVQHNTRNPARGQRWRPVPAATRRAVVQQKVSRNRPAVQPAPQVVQGTLISQQQMAQPIPITRTRQRPTKQSTQPVQRRRRSA